MGGLIETENEWTFNEKRMLKYMLEQDGMQFMRYFFNVREGGIALCNWHHYVMEYVLQAVIDGKITRLIINIAPRYNKTEIGVINFVSRCLALNPRAKFIHTSYSSDLVMDNSSKIKDTVASKEFQELWPMGLRVDKKAKDNWSTCKGGGLIARPSAGQLTGFGAGRMEPGFTGAFIIDDPLKPGDAYSDTNRTRINERFNNTMRSRLATNDTPMIVIMQRIHEDDMSGFLLKGGSGDLWHHLVIPTHLTEEILSKPYDKDYTHGRKIHINDILGALHTGIHCDF